MKILIIKGSPHIRGSSNILAGEFANGAEEAGHTVLEFDAARSKIGPCMGCGSCGMSGDCVLKDDMSVLRGLIMECDLAAFVTPVYYFGMSAQLKTAVDRFYGFNTQLSGKRPDAVLIAAAWDDGEKTFAPLKSHYLRLCEYLGFRSRGMILGGGCGTPAMTAGSESMQKAFALGRSL